MPLLAEQSTQAQWADLVWGLSIALVVGYLLVRMVRRSRAPGSRREVDRLVRRVRASWWHLTSNLGLSYADETTRGRVDLFTGRQRPPRVVAPWMHVSSDEHGVLVRAATLPGVGLDEYRRAAPHLANAWGVERVEVSQHEPGSVLVRGLLSDPLVERWPVTLTGENTLEAWLWLLGRDRFANPVTLALANLAGVKVGGLPGYGKTVLGLSLFAQLAPRDGVQFAVFDGKTSRFENGDWGDLSPRLSIAVGDDPTDANDALGRLVALLKRRPGELRAVHGTNRFWAVGPTRQVPLVVVIIDESHNYTDLTGRRGNEKALIEANQRLLRTLIKEGRGSGVLPVVMTQKQTSDAIPTAARDNLEVGLCFATTTIEAAAAALGPVIRDDRDNCPTQLVDKSRYVGVCTAVGLPGVLGYTRLRVPEIDPIQAAQLAHDTRGLRVELGGSDSDQATPGGGSARHGDRAERRRRGGRGASAKQQRVDAALAALERAERG